MKLLITGGTGFIGSRLALKCLQAGHQVKILGQENTPAEVENRQLVERNGAEVAITSVMDQESVARLLEGVDVVFHLAAAQHEANIPDQRFWDVNVTGTENILQASVEAGVQRFIYGSSIAVYGSPTGKVLDELSPPQPDNIYGITKLEAEKRTLSYGDRLQVVVIRISETYGPGDRRLLKLFKTIKKKVFFMVGRGQNLHHPIYIDDLTEGLLLAATAPQAAGKVLVLAGKEPVTTKAMVTAIAEEVGTTIYRFYAPLPLFLTVAAVMESVLRPLKIQPPLHRRRMDFFRKNFAFTNEQSRQVLGFTPRSDFRQGVAETARWYRDAGYL